MNNLYRVFVFISIFLRVNSVLFDRYSGKKVDEERAKEFRLKKYLDKCTVDIKSCAAHEVSRVSGTCNNYKHPAAGAAGRPYLRLLQPDYANQNEIRRSKTGEQLPSARKVHTSLKVATKYVLDRSNLNAASIHFMELVRQDLSSSNGPLDSLKRNCCTEKADPRCIPIQVDNDPHLQGIHCLNFSRAETFQDLGCTHDITPAQINYQTPLLDLSLIYGVEETSQEGRLYKDGLLKSNKAGHHDLPLNYNTNCFTDNGTCYTIGLPNISPLDLRTTTLAIFFLREHNRLAHALANLNPCWKDDRLFKVARQINVATASNIFMYELMPRIIGYRNMITYDLISTSNDHVTTYDVQTPPGVYAEFDIAMRFFNTFMSSKIEKYNEAYEKVGEIELNKSFLLQSLLENETNFEEINRGTFLQSATNINNIKFPNDDPVSMDIQSGRDFALRGYNEYRDFCGLRIAMEFDDLKDLIDDEILPQGVKKHDYVQRTIQKSSKRSDRSRNAANVLKTSKDRLVTIVAIFNMEKGCHANTVLNLALVEVLKKVYKNVNDVDLLVGILAENNIDSTFVGPTLFCIIVKQLEILRFSNRFWFERGDNYHSFSLAQLSEIRKTNMARLACDNAEGIKYIQPYALMSTSHWNTPVPCSHIPGLELSKWRDASCQENVSTKSEKHDSNQYHFPQYTSFINDIFSSMHLR